MHQAYIDCFFMITKQFADSKDPQLVKFVAFTYKELLMKYLGGRGTTNKCLNPQFFARVFEHCNSSLTKSLIKPLLKYLLPGQKASRKDSAESGTDAKMNRKMSEISGLESID